jgi:endonuclease III-like uncharacterized protein
MRYDTYMKSMYSLHEELNSIEKELNNIKDIQDNLVDKHLTYATHKQTGIVYDTKVLGERVYAIEERMQEIKFDIQNIA